MTRILVVDDSKEVLEALCDFISLAGVGEVTACLSVREALEHLEEERPDVILSDLIMPEMNGFEFKAKLLERMHNPPPFIMMTGSELNDVEWPEAAEFPVIYKPFDVFALVDTIREVIAGEAATMPAASLAANNGAFNAGKL